MIAPRALFQRAVLLGAFLCAACTGVFGVLLLANALRVRGSATGDILVGGSGVLFLLISVGLFTSSAGALHSGR